MTDWLSFAGITGGAGAGLTGLIFIVVGLRFDTIAVSQEFRNRAAQSLTLFLTVTMVAALITVPQAPRAFGIELVLVAFLSAIMLKVLDSAALRAQTTRPNVRLQWALTVFIGCAVVGGLLLLLGARWGMYFYVASAVIGLIGGVNGAWIFLTRAGLEQAAEVK